jgi:hypothetical protein
MTNQAPKSNHDYRLRRFTETDRAIVAMRKNSTLRETAEHFGIPVSRRPNRWNIGIAKVRRCLLLTPRVSRGWALWGR